MKQATKQNLAHTLNDIGFVLDYVRGTPPQSLTRTVLSPLLKEFSMNCSTYGRSSLIVPGKDRLVKVYE